MDTPVLVLPRAADSTQVLVAHLGRISLTNSLPEPVCSWLDDSDLTSEHYDIEIRDMNVYTLDIQKNLTESVLFLIVLLIGWLVIVKFNFNLTLEQI